MNRYFVRISDSDESIQLEADSIDWQDGLRFYRNKEIIALFRDWSYFVQVFE